MRSFREYTRSQQSFNSITTRDSKPYKEPKTKRPKRCERKGKREGKIVKNHQVNAQKKNQSKPHS
jgi:hypothetical protein